MRNREASLEPCRVCLDAIAGDGQEFDGRRQLGRLGPQQRLEQIRRQGGLLALLQQRRREMVVIVMHHRAVQRMLRVEIRNGVGSRGA